MMRDAFGRARDQFHNIFGRSVLTEWYRLRCAGDFAALEEAKRKNDIKKVIA